MKFDSSSSVQQNPSVNGLLRSGPMSNQFHLQTNSTKLKSRNQFRFGFLIVCLTFVFAFLLILTVEFARLIVQHDSLEFDVNLTFVSNQTKSQQNPFESFFASIWIFNLLLFFVCLCLHLLLYKRKSQDNQTKTAFLREFARIFDDGKFSSTNTLADYLLKTCLLCLFWYLFCYLMLRSMSILICTQILILYSITITLRELLGWIFLHELFIGNKIIGHILSLSSLLFLLHNNGFSWNRFFVGSILITISVSIKTIFDILIESFVKDLTSSKMRIVMINICLCGSCLLWPFVLLFHVTKIEFIQYFHSRLIFIFICLLSSLMFIVLKVSIPLKYTKLSEILSILIVIPTVSLIDRYVLKIEYSSLVICSIICSFVGVFLSIIPKNIFKRKDRTKLKQMLNLSVRDSTAMKNSSSSTFEQIRAQRRLRSVLLYNDAKN